MRGDSVTLSYGERNVTLGGERESGHLTQGLIRDINADLADAVGQVERRSAGRVTVTLAVVVGRDKEDRVVMRYSRKGATVEQGALQVAHTGQGRLLEEE